MLIFIILHPGRASSSPLPVLHVSPVGLTPFGPAAPAPSRASGKAVRAKRRSGCSVGSRAMLAAFSSLARGAGTTSSRVRRSEGWTNEARKGSKYLRFEGGTGVEKFEIQIPSEEVLGGYRIWYRGGKFRKQEAVGAQGHEDAEHHFSSHQTGGFVVSPPPKPLHVWKSYLHWGHMGS